MPFTVATLNCELYRTAAPRAVARYLAQLGADVILTQEDVHGSRDGVPAGYTVVADAPTDERVGAGVQMANRILLRTAALPHVYADAGAMKLQAGVERGATPRSAAWLALRHPDGRVRIVVSTHLVGGRNDDGAFAALADVRAQQLAEIVRRLPAAPALIGGDFNAEQEPSRCERAWRRDQRYASRSADDRRAYERYYTSGAAALVAMGYRRAYDADALMAGADGGGGTCTFGTVVDWMYVRPELLRVATTSPAAPPPHVGPWGASDHRAVVATFQ